MNKTYKYVQWHGESNKSRANLISEIMKHWQSRYELGSAVLVISDPESAVKQVQKQWKKLTQALQIQREEKVRAEDILQITRTISRMQRVKFTQENPLQNPNANFYVVSKQELKSLPAHCYTLYSLETISDEAVLNALPAESLLVMYTKKIKLKNFYEKAVLEEQVQTTESQLISWLHSNNITIDSLSDNLENANEALDTLLSSTRLQNEFLAQTKQYLRTIQLASPLKLSAAQQSRLHSIEQLEKHVRVLSPAFLSDHIIDSASDDSFLLRELSSHHVLSLDALKEFIAKQYTLGRNHLAAALEQKAGFIKL